MRTVICEELGAPAALGVGGRGETLDRAWLQLGPAARALARKFTNDLDLRQDLLQEAQIALWQIDPTRFDLSSTREVQYMRRMMTNQMCDAWRTEQAKGLVRAGRA